MTKRFPWDQFDKVTFERGICIRRYEAGEWFYVNSANPTSVSDPDTVLTSLGVRPVLAEGSNGNARVSFLLPAIKGRLLEIYRNELDLPKPLTFVMGAMLYHCSSLARLYAEECARFVEHSPAGMADGGSSSWKKGNTVVARTDAPFYIFETLISTIIIGCEYIRYPIWRKYASAKGIPRNFAETVERCDFSSELEKRIQLSREICYLSAKKFRHCIQHNLDIGSSSWCMFEKELKSFWLFMARLPDNPGEKSASDFTFDQGLDALSVAWEGVSEFFAMTDILLGRGKLSSA